MFLILFLPLSVPHSCYSMHPNPNNSLAAISGPLRIATMAMITATAMSAGAQTPAPAQNPPAPAVAQPQKSDVSTPAIRDLLKQLREGDENGKIAALDKISTLIDEQGQNATKDRLVRSLMVALHGETRIVRLKIIEILGNKKDPAAMPALVQAYITATKREGDNENEMVKIIKGLMQTGGLESEIPSYIRALPKPVVDARQIDPNISAQTDARFIATLTVRRDEVMPLLTQQIIASLAEKHPLRTMERLGMMGSAAADAVPDLSRLLNDPDPEIRQTAARVLGLIGMPALSAIPALEKAQAAGVKAAGPALENLRALQK